MTFTILVPQIFPLHLADIILCIDPAYEDEPVGGVARFAMKLNQLRGRLAHANAYPPLIIFSGDFVGPSLMSSVTHGAHMIEIFNALGVHYATFGNHEVQQYLMTLIRIPVKYYSWIMGIHR